MEETTVGNMMEYLIKILGVTLIAVGGYYAYKTGYHLINYEVTAGLEPLVFAYARPYWEIVLEFIFWLTIITGGIGFFRNKRRGLRIGIYSLILPIFLSALYLVAVFSKKLDYSTTMMVNAEQREMTMIEQWKYIYFEPAILTFLVLTLILTLWQTNKYLKTLKY